MKRRRLILFFPRHATSFSKMLPQSKFLAAQGQWQPMMVLADERTYEFSTRCELEGISFLCLDQELLADPVARAESNYQAVIQHLPRALHNLLRNDRIAHGLVVGLWRAGCVMRGYKDQLAYWLGVLASLNPAVVMMPGDRELGFVPPVLRAAQMLKVTSVICTSNIPTLDSVAAMRQGRHRFSADWKTIPPVLNLVAKCRHPNQMAHSIHGWLLFSPGWLIYALERLGMLSAKPWTQGGGNSNYVILDGERKKQRFLSLGVPKEKIRVVGDFAYDDLYHGRLGRNELRKSIGDVMALDQNAPLVVMAVPIFAEHNMMSWDQHLANLRQYAQILAKVTANVLLSLHPKSPPERYRFLTQEFGFHITELPLSKIISAGDIFICGNSSTIDWAILCGIPVVNMDYVGLKDTAFADCEGVYKVHTPAEFSNALQACLTDKIKLREAQLKAARSLAQFDGKVRERYLAFLNELIELPGGCAEGDCQCL